MASRFLNSNAEDQMHRNLKAWAWRPKMEKIAEWTRRTGRRKITVIPETLAATDAKVCQHQLQAEA